MSRQQSSQHRTTSEAGSLPSQDARGLNRRIHGISSSSIDNQANPGKLLLELNAADIVPSGNSTQLSNFHCIASYNWLDSSTPTILVPGSPAIWSPPVRSRKLNPDHGEVFIDQNAARFGSFPMEPMFRAIYELHPKFQMEEVDVIIDRNSMGKLLDFVTVNSKTFDIDVEVVGNKALFVRKEKQATEFITEFRGFGHTFPEEYTNWDSEVKGSSSHHRIAELNFAGLRYLLRFESDGYLPKKNKCTDKVSAAQKGVGPDLNTVTSSFSSAESLSIGHKHPVKGKPLSIHRKGNLIDQDAVIDIKTRAAHKVLDIESVLPRLWISQTRNLIVGYHRGGRFENVQVLDVQKEIGQWAEGHAIDLQKLDTVIRRVIDTVRNCVSKKCRIKGLVNGKLEVKELDNGHQSALPEDLNTTLKGTGSRGDGIGGS